MILDYNDDDLDYVHYLNQMFHIVTEYILYTYPPSTKLIREIK